MPSGAEVRAPFKRSIGRTGHRSAGSSMRIAAHGSPGSARHRAATSATRLPIITADIACQDGGVGLRNVTGRSWFLTPGRRIIRFVRAEMMAYARIPCHWQSWIGKSELARELTRRGVLAIDP